MTLWSRFRHRSPLIQVLVWVVAWPVPLAFWAAARPPGRRRGPVVLTVVAALVWIAIPCSTSSPSRSDRQVVATGSESPSGEIPAPTDPSGEPVSGADSGAASSTTAGASSTTDGPGTPAPSGPSVEPSTAKPSSTTTARPGQPSSDDPTAVLAGLRVAPEGPRKGYDRELFRHWVDADGDRCNTREEVLIAESRSPAQVDPYGCKVLAGDWFSAYDGLTFSDPSELDIDHVVPLAEAWDSGASAWDAARRQAFANDLEHPEALRAVSASSNRSKGDLDPGQWKPSREAFWCEYARDWVTVKKAWDLTADQNEIDDLRVMLRTCGSSQPAKPSAPSSTTTTSTTTRTAPPVGGGGGVTITALDCGGEAVTVRNGTATPVDLTGWKIHDEGVKHTFSFPTGYTLAPGASVTIRSGGPAGPGELAWTKSPVWNNDGDTATLVNAGGGAVSSRSC